ncbi:adenosylmethionine--8-amino-7-oxononanoate transaminase [Aquicella siphonis]|uniref:adenosylmethionine--8-amino-7-oxononanoate transaminase n=1 Tax=Aquicella siphonis TaxID=254247 RepID=UPI0038B6D9DB
MLDRDMRHIWHPCSQMKDYEILKPLEVAGAHQAWIELACGRRVIDAISSWWCKSLGHGHPRLRRALARQAEKFEHVIFANTTNETLVSLSEKLTALAPGLNKVFYAGDGSSAIEVALKMSLHSRRITGEAKRTRFVALENGYHGETLGALSVSDVGLYRAPYAAMLFEADFISPLPYVSGSADPLWENCEDGWQRIERGLEALADTVTAVIVEPIVQGAGGMKIYSRDFLARLRAFTGRHGIHLIADEIMTGLGRTGKMLACEHAGIAPDFICLSKGLTSGWLPMSAVLTREGIYDLFYDDFQAGKSFLHSHTFSGNALAASVALEVLDVMAEEGICARAEEMGAVLRVNMQEVAEQTGCLRNVRGLGAIAAADLICANPDRRYGFEVYQHALKLGVLLRPLGNTIYWLPPLNIDAETLTSLKEKTIEAIQSVR